VGTLMTNKSENADQTSYTLKNEIEELVERGIRKKKVSPKVLLVNTILFIILLFCVCGWFIYDHFSDHNTTHREINCYVSIPEIVVNLRSVNPKGNILRATFNLQIYNKDDEERIRDFMPIILDQLLSYLRDQSISDLEGPGLERMREAILLRISNIVRPIKIHRVILKDFIIQ
jgi:flagellar basal body-associated protein FliL